MNQIDLTNWQTKKLGEVCEVGAGNSAPQKKEFFIDGKYPFFRTSDVGKVKISKSLNQVSDYLNDKGIKNLKLFKKGTILLPKSGASTFLNHRVIMGMDGYVVSHLATIKTDDKILNNIFLFYLLQEIKAQDLIQDHKYPSLNLAVIKQIQIPLPPLPEQLRIVKILDEVFEKTAKAKENAEGNLQNAKELFESYLGIVFNSEKWEEKKLGEICKKTSNIKWQDYKKEKFKYVDLSAVSRNDFKIISSVLIDYKNAPSRAKKIIKKDDVIFATTRPTLKRIARIFNEYNNQICSTGLVVLRANKNKIFPEMIFYFLQTSMFMENMEKLQRGASYPAVSDNDVKNQIISFPKSLSEQKSIVKKLDALSAETKKLEGIYKQKLSDLEELKKSVLKKAFEGEL